MLSIVPADPRSVEVAFGVEVDMPAVAVMAFDDGQVMGTGGLAWGNGKCWIFFNMPGTKPSYAVAVVRATKKLLRRAAQLGETAVYAARDAGKPRSVKLLTLLGFEMIGHEILLGRDTEIWRWENKH